MTNDMNSRSPLPGKINSPNLSLIGVYANDTTSIQGPVDVDISFVIRE